MPYMEAVSFKQSFVSMINSITVDLNGQSMIQQKQLIDSYNHLRILTSECWTSQNRWSTIGFYPDVAKAGGFAIADSKFAPASNTSNNSPFNIGLSERFQYTLDDSGKYLGTISTSSSSNIISKMNYQNCMFPSYLLERLVVRLLPLFFNTV